MRPRIGRGCVRLGDTEVPLYCGEFHYWRNRPGDWPAILAAMADMGLTAVTSFVQPNVHEYEAGRFDFTGETSPLRDLPRFLELAKDAGLYVHLRPGPACCEWRLSGATSFGTPWPLFGEAFAKAVAPYQVTRGGSLLLIQVHNEWVDLVGYYEVLRRVADEFDGFNRPPLHEWLELCGPHCHAIGAGVDFSLDSLDRYLADTYPDPRSLSAAWGGAYGSFAGPREELIASGVATVADLIRYLDVDVRRRVEGSGVLRPLFDLVTWMKLWMGYAIRPHVDLVRAKTDVLITNNWPMTEEDDFNRVAGADLSGYDHYRPTSVAVWDWVPLAYDLQAGPLPFSAEFMCGTIERYLWGGQGEAPPGWQRFSVLSFFANDLRGINLYMTVERDNWLQCPIDERGGLRPTHRVLGEVFRGLRRLGWHKRRRLADVVVFRHSAYKHLRSPKDLFSDRGLPFDWIREGPYCGRDPKLAWAELAQSLHEEGIDFLVRGKPSQVDELGPDKTLLVFTMPFMEADTAAWLVSYAKAGGHVVMYPYIPDSTPEGGALDALVEAVGAKSGGRVAAAVVSESRRKHKREAEGDAVRISARGSGGRRAYNEDGKLIGIRRDVGSGSLAALGFDPDKAEGYLARLLVEELGCARYARTGLPLSDASVFAGAGPPAVVAYNGHPDQAIEELVFDASLLPDGDVVVVDELAGAVVGPVETVKGQPRVALSVPPRDAVLITLRSASDPGLPKPREASEAPVAGPDHWRMHSEDWDAYVASVLAEGGEAWVRVPAAEWTLPAIASGLTYGVQGWFWLKESVEVPAGAERVELRAKPSGWHNVYVFYVNGREVARTDVGRRGGATLRLDVTDAVRAGGGAGGRVQLAVRVYRQTLDCHDMGACGFDELALAWPGGRADVESLSLRQEIRDDEGAAALTLDDSAWERVELPWSGELRLCRDLVWLRGRFRLPAEAEDLRVSLGGRNAVVTVYLDGEYVVKSPYLPETLSLGPVAAGEHLIALRVVPDDFTAYDSPREQRYRIFIEGALAPLAAVVGPVSLSAACQDLSGWV